MVKKILLLISVSLFAGAVAAADAKGGYAKTGETAGMDPVAPASGQKAVPKADPAKVSKGTKPVKAAEKTAPETIKGGYAKSGETAGMDPVAPASGQKAVEKKK